MVDCTTYVTSTPAYINVKCNTIAVILLTYNGIFNFLESYKVEFCMLIKVDGLSTVYRNKFLLILTLLTCIYI